MIDIIGALTLTGVAVTITVIGIIINLRRGA